MCLLHKSRARINSRAFTAYKVVQEDYTSMWVSPITHKFTTYKKEGIMVDNVSHGFYLFARLEDARAYACQGVALVILEVRVPAQARIQWGTQEFWGRKGLHGVPALIASEIHVKRELSAVSGD